MTLAAAVPVEHRDAFLRATAEALSKYPEGGRGPGLVHREARMLQKYFTSPPKAVLREPKGITQQQTRYPLIREPRPLGKVR
jgi:hypothetical protein